MGIAPLFDHRPLLAALAFALFPAPTLSAEDQPAPRPNFIIIMVDDMGYAGPSCPPYGNPHYPTPGMDRLAAEGLRFTDFHSSGTVCSPTRAGLLTGRYQQRAGLEAVIHPHANHPEHRRGLHEDEVTFAQLFKASGYATGLVGKWHLGYAQETPSYHPMNHGFDYFIGYLSGNIDYVNHWGDHMQHDWWHGRKETKEAGYTTHLINKYALEFIEHNRDKPFCLYIAHESPHAPVQGPNDPVQRGPGAKKRTTPHDEAMKQMILEMDQGVAQVHDKVVELGLDKNTLILFFSDNGDAPRTNTGSPRYRGHKGQVYEGGTRVPAIAWWPGRIKPGSKTDALAISLDVMPTILSLAGIEGPKTRPLDGIDLSGVLLKQQALPERTLYWASLSNSGARSEAIREGHWKLVVQHPRAKPGTFENEQLELFRLDQDPGEKTNLANEQAFRAADMHKRLKTWYADTQESASPQPGGWLTHPGRHDDSFFNRRNLTGWKGNDGYWSVKGASIVGHSDANVPKNEFIWSDVQVKDFYLVVDVLLTPDNRNAGIQFRSKPVNAHGQAQGYQADVGAGVWGKLYHEHGRGKLDWNSRAAAPGVLRRGEWNRYEILAVGHKIWTAINGTLCVALEDLEGERSGKIAFQVHSGPPQTVRYRVIKLVHDPPIALAGANRQQLLAALAGKVEPPAPQSKARPGWTPLVTAWRKKLDDNDPGLGPEPWYALGHDHSKWKTMPLPGFFESKGLPGHDGTVWYRRAIDIPKNLAGRKLTLQLGPIDDMDMTYFNGVQVGGFETPGYWLAQRRYDVPGKLVKAGRAVITVRVIDHGWGGGFGGQPEQMKLVGAGTTVSLAGPWSYQPGVELKTIGLGELKNPPGAPLLVPRTAPASLPVSPLVQPLKRPDQPVPRFDGRFAIGSEQTVVLLGGTNAFECGRHGFLEALMTMAFPKHRLRFRNLAWQADTVYQQQRPRNFYGASKPGYGVRDGREPIAADIAILWMGQSEALGGKNQLDAFTKAYREQVDDLSDYTGRIVLVTPVPFDDPLGIGFDLTQRNESLAAYTRTIVSIGREKGLPVVNLSKALPSPDEPSWTPNGMHLSESGHKRVARAFATQLGFEGRARSMAYGSELFKSLRRLIQRKNELWFAYWRPTNWSFLYGNRQSQPSSRDHRDRSRRWFPGEIQQALAQVQAAEQTIFRFVQKQETRP